MLNRKILKKYECYHWTSEEWYALSKYEHLQIRLRQVRCGLPQLLTAKWWRLLRHNVKVFGIRRLDFALQYQFGWIIVLDDYLCV